MELLLVTSVSCGEICKHGLSVTRCDHQPVPRGGGDDTHYCIISCEEMCKHGLSVTRCDHQPGPRGGGDDTHYCIISCSRGARSARADARLCTSSGINLIVPLSFHLVR